jgi:hypothetical protein
MAKFKVAFKYESFYEDTVEAESAEAAAELLKETFYPNTARARFVYDEVVVEDVREVKK